MNYEADDIERSLKRLVAAVTGQQDDQGGEWTISAEEAQVADDARPFVLIEATREATADFVRASIPQGDIQWRQPFAITAYPSTAGTPAETKQRARKLAQAFSQAVTVGLVDGDGALLSWPLSIPVYDYAGVPVAGTAAERRGPVQPYGAADVDDVAARAIPDPLDDQRWTVPVTLRLSWWAGGRLRADAAEPPTVGQVVGEFTP